MISSFCTFGWFDGMWCFVYVWGGYGVYKGSTSYQGVYGVEDTWVVGLVSDIKGA